MHSRVAQIRIASATNYQSRISYQVNGRQEKLPCGFGRDWLARGLVDPVLYVLQMAQWVPCHASKHIHTHTQTRVFLGCVWCVHDCELRFPTYPPPTLPYPTVMSAGKPRRPRRLWCVCAYGVHA